MGDVILYKDDVDKLNFLLKNLIADAKILSALLITKDTRVLACQGTLATSDTGALAALLVGSFASTQAIAGLIGETEFDTMSHLGKSRNVVISLVNDETILASIFDKHSTCEMITHAVARHTDVLKKALTSIGDNTTNGIFDTGENPPSDGDDDFEKRTDALVKSMEAEQSAPTHQVLSAGAEKHPPQPQPAYAKEIKHPPDAEHDFLERSRHKKTLATPAAMGSAPEIKRPPDTQVLVTESKLTSKDYEVYSLNETSSPPLRQYNPSHDKISSSPQETAKGEAVFTSMNYLKTKAREGALYYHHDKAFFKKFFKSSTKKKA
jgi:predicted regulator of Ras-like GTPase activity (Roadblock/LC7/MglB family)